MTHRSPITAIALVFFAAAPLSAQSAPAFEGIVRYRMTVDGEPVETIYMGKGTKTRSETKMGAHSMITVQDASNGKAMMIMPEARTYSLLDGSGEIDTKLSFKRLGTKSRVLGYECENFRLEIEEGKSEVCAAKGLGVLQAGAVILSTTSGSPAMRAMAAKNPEFARVLREGFLPLRMTFFEEGESPRVMTATSIERKSLDASLFAPPAGYAQTKIPGVPDKLRKP